MSAQHTPGPWVAERGSIRTANNSKWLFHSASTNAYEREANAALGAAAPDMLAALREIVSTLDDPTDATLSQDARKASIIARAAIKKATESPGAPSMKG